MCDSDHNNYSESEPVDPDFAEPCEVVDDGPDGVYDPELNEFFPTDPDANTEQVSMAVAAIAKQIAGHNIALEHSVRPDPACFCAACNLARLINKYEEIREKQNERRLATRNGLLVKAESVMQSRDLDKLKFEGLGKFGYRKMPDKLDTTLYDAMTVEEKTALHNDCPNLFAVKTTVAPDNKAIREVLTTGNADEGLNERVNQTFSISVGGKVFKFKEE